MNTDEIIKAAEEKLPDVNEIDANECHIPIFVGDNSIISNNTLTPSIDLIKIAIFRKHKLTDGNKIWKFYEIQ